MTIWFRSDSQGRPAVRTLSVSGSVPRDVREGTTARWAIPATLCAAAGWAYVSGVLTGRPWGQAVGVLLGSGAAFVVAEIVSTKRPLVAPTVVVALVGVMALASVDQLLARRPIGGPLGYTNADAALFVQAAIAGLLIAMRVRNTGVRILAMCAAGGFGLATVLSGSLAGDVLLAVVVVATVLSRIGRIPVTLWILRSMFVAMLLTTVLLGASYEQGSMVKGAVVEELSERRLVLWRDAIDLLRAHPLLGVGPGGFQVYSPTARSDIDARWAHHEFLQFGAETGVPGMVLLLAAVALALGSAHADQATTTGVLGTAAVAALAIHACVDYVMHFPLVPIVAVTLLGVASGAAHARRTWGGDD